MKKVLNSLTLHISERKHKSKKLKQMKYSCLKLLKKNVKMKSRCNLREKENLDFILERCNLLEGQSRFGKLGKEKGGTHVVC